MAFSNSISKSFLDNDSKTYTCVLERRAEIISKDGFSVVAPIRVIYLFQQHLIKNLVVPY